jgi:hypothetical protein
LEAFARALRREAHNLRQRPDLLWQQMYNRLQWEDEPLPGVLAPELDRRTAPGAAPWLRTRARFRESEALIRTLTGHTGTVRACAISPDSSFIVSASNDDTLKIWDAATGKERLTLTGHTDEVPACAISPDSSFVVSASGDNTLKIWDAATGKERGTLILLGALLCVAIHSRLPFTFCGDAGGNVYFIDLVGIAYEPIIVTAADFGHGPAVRCPFCLEQLPLEEGWLGQVIDCPRLGCEGRMRVNPFVVGPPEKRRSSWQLWCRR